MFFIIQKKLQQKCFRVTFPKFLITSFLQNTSGSSLCELVYKNEVLFEVVEASSIKQPRPQSNLKNNEKKQRRQIIRVCIKTRLKNVLVRDETWAYLELSQTSKIEIFWEII